MVAIETTAFAKLAEEGRLFNSVYKGDSGKPGYYAYRGDFALEFQVSVADEKRPPEYSFEQIVAVAKEGEPTIELMAGYLHNYAWLEKFKEVVGPLLSATGTYYIFIDNIDLLAKYSIPIGEATLTVLPLDESTVWKELSDMSNLDKNDFKKLDGGEKVQLILDKAAERKDIFETISYEEGLAKMKPVRNRNANRPV
jgi:hypothetical protein